MREPTVRWLSKIIALAFVYLLVAKLGLKLATVYPSATPVWPGTGVALAAFLVLGYQFWPGVFLGAFFANLLTAGSAATSLAIASGNTLEGLLGAFLVSKYANGRGTFRRPEDIFKFALLAGGLATTVSATLGTASLFVAGFTRGLPQSRIWLTWWLGDLVGALVITPCLVLWATRTPGPRSLRQRLHGAFGLCSLLFAGFMLFGGVLPQGARDYPLAFLSIPLIVWATFHLRPHEAATAVIAFSGIAIWGTLRGFGQFVTADPNLSLLLLQTFVAVASMTSLVISVAVSERNKIEQALRDGKAGLEKTVAERTAELEQQLKEKKQAEAALHDLSAQLLQIKDEEGRRIARELHDGTAQTLAMSCMNLDMIQAETQNHNPKLAKLASDTAHLVRGVLNETRTISYLLHPPLLDEMGLPSALGAYVDGFRERSGIAVNLSVARDLERFSPEVETAVFRVIQECLTNVHRHSKSASAAIRLEHTGAHIAVQVSDEGEGIPADKLDKIYSSGVTGVGLRGMRERITSLGGSFEVLSSASGTHVKAVIPVHASPQPSDNS
jgi:signal transduction histidine kinase